jgi:hypothetical protein
MSVERRPDEKAFRAQRVREESGLNQSLFAGSTHSKPLQPNRRPVPGAQSKPPLPSNEEVAAIERQWRGEEIKDVEKTEVRSANAKAGGRVVEYDFGLVRWHDGSEFANMGLEALEEGSRR